MAGDWIKVENVTPNKPEIFQIARSLGITRDDAFGKIVRFWIWLDGVTVDGRVDGVALQDVDALLCAPGLTSALIEAKWLLANDDKRQFVVPNFPRHNGKSAKARALTSKRQSRWRSKPTGDDVDAPTSPEKRREEKKRGGAPLLFPTNLTLEALVEAWNQIQGFVPVRDLTKGRRKAFKARCSTAGWVVNCEKALSHAASTVFCRGTNNRGWRADIDWFLRPDSVTRILEGKYDDSTGDGANAPFNFYDSK